MAKELVSKPEDARLALALSSARNSPENLTRVGTISEKLLHKTLKFYIDSDECHHEIRVMGSVADILNSDGIFEIQTRSFEKLSPKLSKLLPEYKMTLVHPLCAYRYVNYVDKESGEILERRKSPKCDGINRAACELYKISDFLPHPNLTVRLMLLGFEEYRFKSEILWRQKRSECLIECTPREIVSVLELRKKEDYSAFLPQGLSDVFYASELAKLVKLDSRRTHNTLTLLLKLGIIERIGKEGRAFLYKKI